MIEKIRIGRISYINVSPVYYGLDRDLKPEWLTMVTEPPAVLNAMLEQGDIVLSPVSSAAYAKNHRDWLVMPDVSISSRGRVMSVLLASHYPLDKLDRKQVVFTEESATAAHLVRYLFAIHSVSPVIETGKITRAQDMARGADAVLVIGDEALIQDWNESFAHVYDLGEVWQAMTGLPFVYAVWAVRRDFAANHPGILAGIKNIFQQSKAMGDVNQADIVTRSSLKTGLPPTLCREYFQHLNCDFTPEHQKGLTAFFDGLYNCGLLEDKIHLELA